MPLVSLQMMLCVYVVINIPHRGVYNFLEYVICWMFWETEQVFFVHLANYTRKLQKQRKEYAKNYTATETTKST